MLDALSFSPRYVGSFQSQQAFVQCSKKVSEKHLPVTQSQHLSHARIILQFSLCADPQTPQSLGIIGGARLSYKQ
jgi:hypothetical protein